MRSRMQERLAARQRNARTSAKRQCAVRQAPVRGQIGKAPVRGQNRNVTPTKLASTKLERRQRSTNQIDDCFFSGLELAAPKQRNSSSTLDQILQTRSHLVPQGVDKFSFDMTEA